MPALNFIRELFGLPPLKVTPFDIFIAPHLFLAESVLIYGGVSLAFFAARFVLMHVVEFLTGPPEAPSNAGHSAGSDRLRRVP